MYFVFGNFNNETYIIKNSHLIEQATIIDPADIDALEAALENNKVSY